ncbi:zinc chelation protein SecC [Methylobacterium sp. Leaf399]|uniref:DUF1186 domain-containing protein n=1 Tax=unclassified Methylobacterium TaxID=2615210 RepID=UPI0006F44CF6|nr:MULTISPECIES: DUF1186 domain-containing protein [unclassified Methylobacterium]KQP61819.1 zinc chelation protein SecC [Methylobacterium sp. Leaf108]KQT20087.1 zinc chelation protein SecC [Methylobacterium sp. Leaf399]KQT80684.1 zinc chelation protein SecC [Methylobacterium sp. Leaf466]
MVDPILVADLSAENHLPAGALRRALKAPASIAEPVLAVLDAAASEAELIEEDVNLLFWGVHVLAAARDSRAYAPLMRLLRQDGDSLEAILGDALTTTLAKVVVSVFDGDVAPMHRLILDSTTDEFVRYELLTALVFLTHAGRIDRAQTHDLLVRFDDKRVSVEAEIGWTGWEEAIALLGFADLAPRVEAARKDGRITDEISDLPWFRTTLRQALAKPDDPSRFDPRRYGPLDDPIAELAWTAEDAGQPLRNPLKDVGRNDPCPCGSGKKFKKCCLGATPA